MSGGWGSSLPSYGRQTPRGPSPAPTYAPPDPHAGGALQKGEYGVASQTNDWFWYNNIAVINPTDFNAEFADRRSGETQIDVLLNDRYVVRVCAGQRDEHSTLIPGQRGVSKPVSKPIYCSLVMREYMQLSMLQPVHLKRYPHRGEEISKMDVELRFLQTPQEDMSREMLDGDLLAETVLATFHGQILAPGVTLAHTYKHKTDYGEVGLRLRIGIKSMETYVPNRGSEKPGVGVGKPSRDPKTRGMLTKETLIEVFKAENFAMKLTPSTKTVKSIIRHDISFESMGIGGLDEQFNQIFRRAFASRQFPPGLVQKMGIQHVKGILLYGPPGTGKTLIARQIGKALEAREPKIVNGPEVLNKFVGQSEENIRKLFEEAEAEYKKRGDESELHIIIFDELDAICKQRGGKNDGTGVGDSVVNQLLSKMDGVDQLNNVLIIGMTNRMDMIDEALLRPGRLEVHIEIALPDEAGRVQILTIHTNKLRTSNTLSTDVNIPELASVTTNFSGAEIAGLVKSATSFAFNRVVAVDKKYDPNEALKISVNRNDFMHALEEVKPAFGVSEEEFEQCTTGGVIRFSHNIDNILSEGRLFVEQVRKSDKTPLVSVLLHGPPGSGKTALAATIAMASKFPFIKLVSPEGMVGFNEMSKINYLTKVFMDAYKSPLNIVVMDNIERIVGWVPVGPSFSNPVLQTLVTLLRKPPPKGRRLLIIATSMERGVLGRLDLLNSFDAEIGVPNVADVEELRWVMDELQAFSREEQETVVKELQKAARSARVNVGIKKILMAVETARQDDDKVGRFVQTMTKAVLDMVPKAALDMVPQAAEDY